MSLRRRNARAARSVELKKRRARRLVDLTLFLRVPAPNAECEKERRELGRFFQQLARDWHATSLAKLWTYLQECREEYDPKQHGPSRNVDFVDSVMALREVEKEELAKQRESA